MFFRICFYVGICVRFIVHNGTTCNRRNRFHLVLENVFASARLTLSRDRQRCPAQDNLLFCYSARGLTKKFVSSALLLPAIPCDPNWQKPNTWAEIYSSNSLLCSRYLRPNKLIATFVNITFVFIVQKMYIAGRWEGSITRLGNFILSVTNSFLENVALLTQSRYSHTKCYHIVIIGSPWLYPIIC